MQKLCKIMLPWRKRFSTNSNNRQEFEPENPNEMHEQPHRFQMTKTYRFPANCFILLAALALAGILVSSSAMAALESWQTLPSAAISGSATVSPSIDLTAEAVETPQTNFKVAGTDSAQQFYREAQQGGGEELRLIGTRQDESEVAVAQRQTAFGEDFVSLPRVGGSQLSVQATSLTDVSQVAYGGAVPAVPEMNALFPILGLLAAFSSTQILRRRRAARLNATRM